VSERQRQIRFDELGTPAFLNRRSVKTMIYIKSRNLKLASKILQLVSVVGILSAFATGCSPQSDDAKAAKIKQVLIAQQNIVLKSGGSWNNLSPAEQQAMTNGPGYGNQQAAQAYLQASYARAMSKPDRRPTSGPASVQHSGQTKAASSN